MNDICQKELNGCCCLRMLGTLWRRSLPSSVKQAVADYDFTKANLKEILQVADDVYQSTRPATATVAAISAPTLTPPETALPESPLNTAFHSGFSPEAQQVAAIAAQAASAQVAAIYRGRGGRGRNNRGGRGARGGRGGQSPGSSQKPQYSAQNPRHKTPRHPDLPPFGVCKRHWQFGKASFVCLEPWSCEWKNFIQPQNKN